MEEDLRRAVLEGRNGRDVEAAHAYALWLEGEGRLDHAARVIEAALREGPDFGSRAELACVTLLDALEASWKRVNEKRGVAAVPGGVIYNEGLSATVAVDWKAVLAW